MRAVVPAVALTLAFAGCVSTKNRNGDSAPQHNVWHQKDPKARGPYSGAAGVARLVFVSGKIGDPQQPFEAQVVASLAEVERQLLEAGSSWRHTVSVTVYLTDMDRFTEFNRLYTQTLGSEPYPARAVVEVTGLPAGAVVMVSAIATRQP